MKTRSLAALISIIIAFTSRAAEKFTPHHIAKLRAVTSAVVSPDSGEVAYLLSVPRKPMVDDDGPAFVELHVVNARGESRPFIAGKVTISEIDWTPDGKGISYVAKRDKDEQ